MHVLWDGHFSSHHSCGLGTPSCTTFSIRCNGLLDFPSWTKVRVVPPPVGKGRGMLSDSCHNSHMLSLPLHALRSKMQLLSIGMISANIVKCLRHPEDTEMSWHNNSTLVVHTEETRLHQIKGYSSLVSHWSETTTYLLQCRSLTKTKMGNLLLCLNGDALETRKSFHRNSNKIFSFFGTTKHYLIKRKNKIGLEREERDFFFFLIYPDV